MRGTPPQTKNRLAYRMESELGVLGNLSVILKPIRQEGSFGFYGIQKDLLSLAFKRIGNLSLEVFRQKKLYFIAVTYHIE